MTTKQLFHLIFSFGFFMNLNAQLVDIQIVNPKIVVELKYATPDNFTKHVIYPSSICYLHEEVANRLDLVQKELEELGLGIKIWDGYRPMSAQWKFWTLVPDERYVSDPRKGGRHTRGTAVDLTLITSSGHELIMPTSFDDFSEKAYRDSFNCDPIALRNKRFLQEIMERHGFIGLATEWWHFDLSGWETYPVIEEWTPAAT